MSELTADEITATAPPTALPLQRFPFVACDGHAEPTIQAVFAITPDLTKGAELVLCLHCARKAGFAVDGIKTWLHEDASTKSKGNDHA